MLEVNMAAARRQMVDQQVRGWGVIDTEVVAVMSELARERYAPERYRNLAYADSPIPIGHGEVMLLPSVQGRIMQAVQVAAGERVLEIGTGTGYLTACLAALGGRVRSVDIHEEFVAAAGEQLAADGFGRVELACADAHTLEAEGPEWHVIVVTGSLPERDPSFPRRLAEGGRLLWIVGEAPAMRVEVVTRTGSEEWRTTGLFETVVPALVGTSALRRFEF
ncbi:MAG: protein-L-isoaspartate O-methyltransferase family protein [Gammaproteobacteria bacterium]